MGGLPEINARVQQVGERQSWVFQALANRQQHLAPEVLVTSFDLRSTLNDPTEEEVQALVGLMSDDSGKVTIDRYQSVLRSWNIFNECDLDGNGSIDDKEMEVLLWIQLSRKPDPAFVHEFVGFIDTNRNGVICRKEWVQAVVDSHNGVRLLKAHAAAKEE